LAAAEEGIADLVIENREGEREYFSGDDDDSGAEA
jgi:hypothetical protein